jgi:hypothetical protein
VLDASLVAIFKKMKTYFKRENVVTLLGLLFSGMIFFGFKFLDTKSNLFDEYESAIDSISASNERMRNSQIIAQFTGDSLININRRIIDYGSFLISARKHPEIPNYFKSVELKRAVLNDIARLSKFENEKVFDEFPNFYAIYIEYLLCEKRMVNWLHQFSLASEAKSYHKTKQIYAEMESTFFELESLNSKIYVISNAAESKIPQQKPIALKHSEDFLKKQNQKSSLMYMYLTAFWSLFVLWIAVFSFSIKYETFKK